MEKPKIYLSIVIPAYNEEKRLESTLKKISFFLQKQDFKSEIVLVDDGSTDATLGLANRLASELSLNLVALKNSTNMGKGAALKKGMLAANGEIIMFTDADLSTPIEELKKFLPYLSDYQLVIGSRKIKGAEILVHQPFYRELMGKFYTALARSILGVSVSDFTCGFKVFTQEAAKAIFSRLKVFNWSFDAEVLYLAKKLGYQIKEVPVVWSDCPNTKVKLRRDVFSSFFGLLQIRLSDLRKEYDT